MPDKLVHMNWKELVDFYEANLDGMEECRFTVLMKRHGQWALCIGETGSDGVFRHVDVTMDESRAIGPALRTLQRCLAGRATGV